MVKIFGGRLQCSEDEGGVCFWFTIPLECVDTMATTTSPLLLHRKHFQPASPVAASAPTPLSLHLPLSSAPSRGDINEINLSRTTSSFMPSAASSPTLQSYSPASTWQSTASTTYPSPCKQSVPVAYPTSIASSMDSTPHSPVNLFSLYDDAPILDAMNGSYTSHSKPPLAHPSYPSHPQHPLHSLSPLQPHGSASLLGPMELLQPANNPEENFQFPKRGNPLMRSLSQVNLVVNHGFFY